MLLTDDDTAIAHLETFLSGMGGTALQVVDATLEARRTGNAPDGGSPIYK